MKKTMLVVLASFSAAVLIAFASTAPAEEEKAEALSIEDQIIQEKCTLCHTSKRIFTIDPETLKPTLERMQKMNPEWITDIDRDHVAEVLTGILNNSSVIAIRKAWKESVDRGKTLFSDTSLGGSKGFNCKACHTPQSLSKVHDAYPQYQPEMKRFISLEDKINLMVVEKMEGEAIPRQDPRMTDLIAYLKTL